MPNLSRANIEKLHKIISSRFPTTQGRINDGKIDIILEKPNFGMFGTAKYDTIYKKAACILEGFCRGHVFADGNKRTALLAASQHLQINGCRLVIPQDAVEFLLWVARNEAQTEEEIDELIFKIAVWLEERTATNEKEFSQKYEQFVKNHPQ